MNASVFARVWHLCTARTTAVSCATAIANKEEEGRQKSGGRQKSEARQKSEGRQKSEERQKSEGRQKSEERKREEKRQKKKRQLIAGSRGWQEVADERR